MKGIMFGNFHSYDDLHLILTSKEIGSPAVKVNKIDVEGADSALDLTDFFGEPKYEDVTHKFEFSTIIRRPSHVKVIFPSFWTAYKDHMTSQDPSQNFFHC